MKDQTTILRMISWSLSRLCYYCGIENCIWPSLIRTEAPGKYWDKTRGSNYNSSIFNNISLLLIYICSHFYAPYLNVLWLFQNNFLFPALFFFNTLTMQLWRGVYLKMICSYSNLSKKMYYLCEQTLSHRKYFACFFHAANEIHGFGV